MNNFKHVRILATITLKELIQQTNVDSQKTFGTIGLSSHSNTTTQLVIERKKTVLLDSQSNKLNKINNTGLLDKNFLLAILEFAFPISVPD